MPILGVGSKNASKARVKQVQEIGIPQTLQKYCQIEEKKNTSKHSRILNLQNAGPFNGPQTPCLLVQFPPSTSLISLTSNPYGSLLELHGIMGTGTRSLIEPLSEGRRPDETPRPGGCWSSEVPLRCPREARAALGLSHGSLLWGQPQPFRKAPY